MKLLKRVIRVLDAQQRKQVVGLVILMLIGALLETVGTSLILPLITAATSPDSVLGNKYMRAVYHFFRLESVDAFLIMCVILLIVVYVCKSLFLYFMYRTQYRFVYNGMFKTSRRLFKDYVGRPYEFYLDASTPEVLRNIVSDSNGVYNMILTILKLSTEAVIFLALFTLSIVVSPVMTLMMTLFIGAVLLINRNVFGPILRRFGHEVRTNNALVTKWLMQAMTGMKETKVLNREAYFIHQYEDSSQKLRDIQIKQQSMSNIPRLSIETVMMVGLLTMIGIFMARGEAIGSGSTIGQLALLAMVAVRMMPSSNRIVQALNDIAYYEPSLTGVEDIIVRANEQRIDERYRDMDLVITPMPFAEKVELREITYRYPGTDNDILEKASLTIPLGASVGLIGPSGAGKSTAVDLLLGLLKPREGAVLVDGKNIEENPEGWVHIIGYVPQMMFMLDDTIRNNVAYGVPEDKINEERVWEVLREAQMEDFIKGLPMGLDTSIGERGVRLSGGQRQRIGIARALYNDPQIMIFDEATSALDSDTESAIMEAIERLHGKKTLIIVAHRLTTIADCDAVYKVDGRQFLPQTKEEILQRIHQGDNIEEEQLPAYELRRSWLPKSEIDH